MRTVVTGGAGFIGSTLVDRLRHDGHQVLVVDDLSRGRIDNLDGALATSDVDLEVLDIGDDALGALLGAYAPEVVFHLAAQIDVRHSVTDPIHDAEANILGSVKVASAALTANSRKIVFMSSGGSIYGSPEHLPVSEQAPVNPQSPYACSKVSAEYYLNCFRQLHGLDCSHIAPSNVYGPRQDPHGEAGVVAIFAREMLSGGKTFLFGDGENTRDYVFVEDVVTALVAASGTAGSGQRFNIGTGTETSDRELHALLAQAVGVVADPTWLPARPGDVRRSALDAGSARRELDWTPSVSLPEGIARTVEFFRSIETRATDAMSSGMPAADITLPLPI